MKRTMEAIVNDALNLNADLLSDMAEFSDVPTGSEQKEGFAEYSKLFCDSIIFWGLHNSMDEKSQPSVTGRYIATLREIFNNSSLEVESIKPVCSGQISRNSDYFSAEEIKKLQERNIHKYFCAGYIGIKVSLHNCGAKKLIKKLGKFMPEICENNMVLHDVDLAHDCQYISTRSFVEAHLKENGIKNIVDDRNRVGDHCISWMGSNDDDKDIRFKVYNKFVQILESAEVRKSLGCRMEKLVAKEGNFATRLERYKDDGYSRLELTFYGPNLLTIIEYQKHMKKAQELLSDCTTFQCSFEAQWVQRAANIASMVAVYFPKKKIFAYCHWWNSLTSKKCGYQWKVAAANVSKLLANYSFNDRPIHYMECDINHEEKPVVIKQVKYMREPGCTAITLVAGDGKGMYPSRDNCAEGVKKFSDVGIVEVANINIAWPKKRHNKQSANIAELVEADDDNEDDEYIKNIKITRTSSYLAAYSALEPKTKYTIVAAGYANYRKIQYMHFITECGIKFRAGKSLTDIWDKWRVQSRDDGLLVDGEMVKKMNFMTVKKVKVQGLLDIKCKLA
jgi:hypothetical protein